VRNRTGRPRPADGARVALIDATLRNVCLADVGIEDANLGGMRIDGVLVTDLLRAFRVSG